MAGSNTEKPTGKAEAKKMVAPKEAPKKKKVETAPVKKEEKKKEDTNTQIDIGNTKNENKETVKKEDKEKENKETVKKEDKKIENKKVKKSSVSINSNGVAASTKVSTAICKFIKHKPIEVAIKDLEAVTFLKKAIPMKGEIPHRRGRIMSGRFPVRASKEFIILLKSLQGNANNHDVENPVISEAIANKGTTTYAKGGRARKKRTNLKIIATAKKENKK